MLMKKVIQLSLLMLNKEAVRVAERLNDDYGIGVEQEVFVFIMSLESY